MKCVGLCFIMFFLSACATHVVDKQQKVSNLNLEIAMNYLQQGSSMMAKQHFLLALQESPKDPIVLSTYGLYLEKVGDPQAEQYYQQAVELNPHSAMAHNNYGTYLCRHQQYSAAIAQFQQAIDQADYLYTATTYENMGICSDLAKQTSAAKQYFVKALRYDPSLQLSKEMLSKKYG